MSEPQYARFTPRFPLPKAFPDNESGTHDPVIIGAAAMNDAAIVRVLEDITVEFACRHGRAHDPNSFLYSDGSAKKVDGRRQRTRARQARS